MKSRMGIAIGVACVLFWATTTVLGGRGGGRGGGGGARGGGARGGGGMRGGGMSRPPSINRTPSFSRPAGGGARPNVGASRPSVGSRPSHLPANRPGVGGGPGIGSRPGVGSRPSQLPANRPGVGAGPGIGSRPSQLPANRPGVGGGRPDIGGGRPNVGNRPSQLPATGGRPGIGNGRPNLPSTRPDFGGRPGIGGPGISTLPVTGGAALGGALGNRLGDRPAATLPGLGDRTPGVSQLPARRTPQERREALNDRLSGDRLEGQPPRDWNQTRQDWRERRDDIREDWQDHRDNAREDWQNWFDDHYYWHGRWYWGHAPGYWGHWDYLWDRYPVAAAVGLTWWGANALGYQYGCSDYYNPYYSDTTAVDYSAPVISLPVELPTDGQAPTALPPDVPAEAVGKFDQARAAFLDGKYENALKLTDEAVAKMPQDAVLHEFRSLVLFALKRYPESAAAIHAVLAVGPGWDWKTLSSLYPDVDTYTAQLRALEHYRDP